MDMAPDHGNGAVTSLIHDTRLFGADPGAEPRIGGVPVAVYAPEHGLGGRSPAMVMP